MANFTPLDAVLNSRLLDVRPGVPRWFMDWACTGCQRYGSVEVELTGGPTDPRTGLKLPKTTDEELDRKFFEAHRQATKGLCARSYKELRLGEMWRWNQTPTGRQMIILERRGGPPAYKYKWPPWAG